MKGFILMNFFCFIALQDKINLFHHHLLIIFIPILDGRQAGYFFKHIPESLSVRVTHIIHYFIYVFSAGFKCALCGFYFYALHVFHNGIISCFFKPAFKSSSACSAHIGKLVYGYFILVIILNKVLYLFYFIVVMITLPLENHKG